MSDLVPEGDFTESTPKKRGKNIIKGIIVAILGLLLVSPIDIIPDAIPVVGLLDDVGYILGIIGTLISMFVGKKKD